MVRQDGLWMYQVTLITALIWMLALLAPPWLMAGGRIVWALVGYELFSIICHQLPERSWRIFGFPLAVCSRCTAIYFGGLLGLLIYPLTAGIGAKSVEYAARSRRWLLWSLPPMLFDFGLDWIGVMKNTFLTRTLTGLLVGMAGALHLYHLLAVALTEWRGADSRRNV
jgi:uncharacterized membrane protein